MRNRYIQTAIFVTLFLSMLCFLFALNSSANSGSTLQALINNMNLSDLFYGYQQDNESLVSNTPAALIIASNTLTTTSTPTNLITITPSATHTPTPTVTTTSTHTATNTAALTATSTQIYYTIATATPGKNTEYPPSPTQTNTPTHTTTTSPTGTNTPTNTNTPTPTPTKPPDTALGISISGLTDCYQVEFDVTVENRAERSDATDVVVQLTVIRGVQYVTSISPNPQDYGDIAPGTSKTLKVIMTLNDFWLTASGRKRIQVSAIVIQETSRPEFTVGISDTATITHPGNCLP